MESIPAPLLATGTMRIFRAGWSPATSFALALMAWMSGLQSGVAQVDPYRRNLLQLGWDQPVGGQGPQGVYAYYYYNNPEAVGTNTALRLALAPAYIDGEVGFRQLLSPYTDVGLGFYGGAYGDNYYEVRQGNYRRTESFDGHGGGIALSVYQLLNPGMRIPLNVVGRGGVRYSTYARNSDTRDDFELPDGRPMPFVRAGLRLAGKEPVLYPDLGLELSVWYERQWRLNDGAYGLNRDRFMNEQSDLYWVYAGLDYAWTNVGHKISFAATAGGSEDADRFSAWRLGGVLPLIAEFPLILPGYFYQELTAKRFVHLYASYLLPLGFDDRLQFRMEAASAALDYLDGFEQPDKWQTGVGCGLTYTPKNKICRIVLRYGYGFDAIRDTRDRGAHSVGLLLQYDFEQHKNWRRNAR